MRIVVSIKHAYGNEYVMPVCEKAKLFSSIAGSKSLNNVLPDIVRLGYDVEYVSNVPSNISSVR